MRASKLSLTTTAAKAILGTQHNLWKASKVTEFVRKNYSLEVSNAFVSKALRNILRMRYKRVTRVAPQANSEASLVKRLLCAKVLLTEMRKGKRVINIDETWIGETDYRRRKWRAPGDSNSLSSKDVTPRISMIAAIDDLGGLYFSLIQANVDHEVFALFMTKLVRKLTTEDANWSQKTVILLDNAPYHKEFGLMQQLRLQGCSIIYLGPYSFSAAPCELLFSALKRTQLNPDHLPTGKK